MESTKCARPWLAALVVVASFLVLSAAAWAEVVVSVQVPGWSDPWLAGMPDGSVASCWPPEGCDVAPAQSPQRVVGLCLNPGEPLTFLATGSVLHYPGTPTDPPDGSYVTNHNWDDDYGENGISDVNAPYDCLLGVFLTDDRPDQSPDPPNLDFSTQESRDFLVLSPRLKQVFFIGDGRTSQGAVQEVIVPAGATRLFLGTMDSSTWLNNVGRFDVLVHESCGPTANEASSWGELKSRHR
jgi:hypothetical protein